MKKLPTIICSSTIRSAQEGESHGGMYLVDLENETFKQVINWNDNSIDWEGRGSDRGLRGIAYYKDNILCAASDELVVYDKNFEKLKSFKSKYLKYCHEIYVWDNFLYLTSTGFDSILEFDLLKEKYTRGFLYRTNYVKNRYISSLQRRSGISKKIFKIFDPNSNNGPELRDTNHINNVFVINGLIFFSGTGLDKLFVIENEQLKKVKSIPKGTHNVTFHKDYLIFNNTANNTVDLKTISGSLINQYKIPQYKKEYLINSDIPNDHARQGFGRGLICADNLIIGGSSPATISVYSIPEKKLIKSVNLTMDIKNAIHGLELYPFSSSLEAPKKVNQVKRSIVSSTNIL